MMGAAGVLLAIVSMAVGQARDVKSDETLIFFPTYGRQVDDGRAWELYFHGWIFEIEWRAHVLGPLYDAMDLDDAIEDSTDRRDEDDDAGVRGSGGKRGAEIDPAAAKALFKRRAGPFIVDNQRGKRVVVKFGSRLVHLMPSEANGHFEGRVQMPVEEIEGLRAAQVIRDHWLTYRAVLPKGDERTFEGRVQLIEPDGVSIVSDIDDTIKSSHVTDHKEALRRTFLLPFEPVPGMPELYMRWSKRPDVVIHYVSSSPWQLYEPLAEFLRPPRFPEGTFALRPFRLKGLDLLSALKSGEEHKPPIIEALFERFGRRRFVLIGDAGEHDPEIFARLAENHPGRVAGIFIRDTRQDATSPRYRAAFAKLKGCTVAVFRDPKELVDLLPTAVDPKGD